MCRIVKCSERAFNDQINRELILFHAFRVIFDALEDHSLLDGNIIALVVSCQSTAGGA
jgi:hypothetical protein